MTKKHPTLFITHRGERHQQDALGAAPAELNITMLRSPSKEEIIAALPSIEFLITERSGVIDADIIQTGKNLRLIQRLGSQTYDIDLKSAKKAGIPVCYLPVHSCIMVAEHMVLQILSLSKRLREVMDLTGYADDFGHPSKLCDEDYFAYKTCLVCGNPPLESLVLVKLATNWPGVCRDMVVIFCITNAIDCQKKRSRN